MPRMHPRAAELIRDLALAPHPEGGRYRRVHVSAATVATAAGPRPASSAIRFLLCAGERSAWHRIDADEAWHWQEGGPLALTLFDGREVRRVELGPSAQGGMPMQVVPAGTWQSARPLGDFSLVACLVAPGFEWGGFELLDAAGDTARELARLGVLHEDGRVGSSP